MGEVRASPGGVEVSPGAGGREEGNRTAAGNHSSIVGVKLGRQRHIWR
jgi:hypothetical protein